MTERPGAGKWSPSKAQWDAIHSELPPTADLHRFDQEVLLGVWLYLGTDASKTDLEDWKRVVQNLRSTDYELCKAINRLHSESPMATTTLEFLNVLRGFTILVDSTRESTLRFWELRRELLYANLLAACTGPGELPLNVSDSGPLTRIMTKILELVLPDPPSRYGIKAIIQRERARRAKGVGVGGILLP